MVAKISAQTLKQAITLFYLLAYCPPGKLNNFLTATAALQDQIAGELGVSRKDIWQLLAPEVCERILSFHSAKHQPENELIEQLLIAAQFAPRNTDGLAAYQSVMGDVFTLPGRAKPNQRLHRKKGCRFCENPCAYGYFSLVSEPRFDLLQQLLNAEKSKAPAEKSAVRAAWSYAVTHITQVAGIGKDLIATAHLGNLAYCLLMLSMAKSRYPLPEKQVQIFQSRNQQIIAKLALTEM